MRCDRGVVAILGASILVLAPALQADGVAWEVKDLRTQTSSSGYLGGDVTEIDLGVLVDLDWLNLGRELWVTDGTLAGTRLMANIAPGSMGSDPVELGKIGSTVLLAATTPAAGRELWRTNGRAWGTAQVLDIRPGPASSDPEPLGFVGGVVLFTADDGVHGRELWASDGTAAGTYLLADIFPGPEGSFQWGYSYEASDEIGGEVLFAGRDDVHGLELWVTDGTPAGTGLLLDLKAGAASSVPRSFITYGGSLYFQADDGISGSELWASDGTAAGTHLFADLAPGAGSSDAEPIGISGHGLLLTARETASSDRQLWVTDGTVVGTSRLGTVKAQAGGAALGSRVLFTGNDGDYDWEPWVTDGTLAGTRRLGDLYPGAYGSDPYLFHPVRGLAYFCASDTGSLGHLFRNDGTAAGTRRLGAVSCDWVEDAAEVGGGALLNTCWEEWNISKCPGCGYTVCRLWRSDGTNAGTWSLYPGSRQLATSYPAALTPREGGLFFAAEPDLPWCNYTYRYPFVTDGTTGGTTMLTAPDGSAVCSEREEAAALPDGEVLFRGWQAQTGSEVWATDASGAHLVRDVQAGPAGSEPAGLARVGSLVYFGASTPETGSEPWISDGTPGGTGMLKDLATGALGSSPWSFTDVFDWTWFSSCNASSGCLLWDSGGTAATTTAHLLSGGATSYHAEQITPLDAATGSLIFRASSALYSYDPGTSQATLLRTLTRSWPYPPAATLAVANSTLYFVDETTSGGCQLWASDGTAAGTQVVANIDGAYWRSQWYWYTSPCPGKMVAFAGQLLFPACDLESGCELWTNDGTAAGTHRFADLEPGPGSFLPWSLTVIGDRLYFAGCRAASGCEPWVTDGSAAGTHRVADIALGPPSSDPHDFTLSGRRIYFVADDASGEELWAMPMELFYDGFETGDTTRWSP